MTIIDISDLVMNPEKRADHIFAATGRTQAIKAIVINQEEAPRQKELLFAWSYALHHVFKTSNKREIVNHIARYATNPLHRNYPTTMLYEQVSTQRAYRQAREEYCKAVIIPIVKQLHEADRKWYGEVARAV